MIFKDKKKKLKYNIRVLKDYIREKKINLNNLKYIPSELLDAIKMNKTELIDLYQKASYSVLDQELNKPVSISTFHDFLELIKLGHFELTNDQIDEAINYYNSLSNNNIKNINEKFNIDFDKKYHQILNKYKDYFVKTSDGYTFNLNGILISNVILSEFLL